MCSRADMFPSYHQHDMLALMFGALHVAFRNISGVEALLLSWALDCCSTAGLGCCSAVATLLGWPLTADTCHF